MARIDEWTQADRNRILERGDQIYQDSRQRGGNREQNQLFWDEQAANAYFPLLEGRGGYSPEEIDQILREEELYGLLPNDYDANFLTPEEQAQIRGNPWARAAFYNPEYHTGQQDESERFQRGAVDRMGNELTAAINPDDLVLSGEYDDQTGEAMSGTEGRVRGTLDRSRLTVDPTVLNRLPMSDEEKNRIVTGAGISSGVGYRSAIGELERRATAAGLDPMAVAAMRKELEQKAAGAAGDAMTQARIRADAAQRDSLSTAEQMRLAAERGYAGLATGAEMEMGGRRLATAGQREQLRMGGTRDVSDRQMDAARQTGMARVGSEAGINAQRRDVNQFNTRVGTDIATGIERDESGRAAEIAANRQTVNRANQGDRFNRGYQVNREAATRRTGVADERLNQQREARQYASGRANREFQGGQMEADRQLSAYTGQAGAQRGNTGIEQQREATKVPWWQRVAQIGANAAAAYAGGMKDGGVVTKPTVAILGENGPEKVIPMNQGKGGWMSAVGAGMEAVGGKGSLLGAGGAALQALAKYRARRAEQRGDEESMDRLGLTSPMFEDDDDGYVPMAEGGLVTQPTKALIGENGPEAVVPLNKPKAPVTATAEAPQKGFGPAYAAAPDYGVKPMRQPEPMQQYQPMPQPVAREMPAPSQARFQGGYEPRRVSQGRAQPRSFSRGDYGAQDGMSMPSVERPSGPDRFQQSDPWGQATNTPQPMPRRFSNQMYQQRQPMMRRPVMPQRPMPRYAEPSVMQPSVMPPQRYGIVRPEDGYYGDRYY